MNNASILAAVLLGLGALACNQESQPEPMTPASGSQQEDPSPGLDTKSGEPTPDNTEPATGLDPGAGDSGS